MHNQQSSAKERLSLDVSEGSPASDEGEGGSRRISAIGSTLVSLPARSISDGKVVPQYQRASTGSCHDHCKFGHKGPHDDGHSHPPVARRKSASPRISSRALPRPDFPGGDAQDVKNKSLSSSKAPDLTQGRAVAAAVKNNQPSPATVPGRQSGVAAKKGVVLGEPIAKLDLVKGKPSAAMGAIAKSDLAKSKPVVTMDAVAKPDLVKGEPAVTTVAIAKLDLVKGKPVVMTGAIVKADLVKGKPTATISAIAKKDLVKAKPVVMTGAIAKLNLVKGKPAATSAIVKPDAAKNRPASAGATAKSDPVKGKPTATQPQRRATNRSDEPLPQLSDKPMGSAAKSKSVDRKQSVMPTSSEKPLMSKQSPARAKRVPADHPDKPQASSRVIGAAATSDARKVTPDASIEPIVKLGAGLLRVGETRSNRKVQRASAGFSLGRSMSDEFMALPASNDSLQAKPSESHTVDSEEQSVNGDVMSEHASAPYPHSPLHVASDVESQLAESLTVNEATSELAIDESLSEDEETKDTVVTEDAASEVDGDRISVTGVGDDKTHPDIDIHDVSQPEDAVAAVASGHETEIPRTEAVLNIDVHDLAQPEDADAAADIHEASQPEDAAAAADIHEASQPEDADAAAGAVLDHETEITRTETIVESKLEVDEEKHVNDTLSEDELRTQGSEGSEQLSEGTELSADLTEVSPSELDESTGSDSYQERGEGTNGNGEVPAEGRMLRTASAQQQNGSSSATPYKLKFRRGKVIEIPQDNGDDVGPRRLKFRRRASTDDNNVPRDVQLVRRSSRRVRAKEAVAMPKDGHPDDHNEAAAAVRLRHHGDAETRQDAKVLFNNVIIEQAASKLAETRKSKVKALVGAFETVISLQDGKQAKPTAATAAI